MLDSDVDSLWDDSSIVVFVDDNTDGMGSDVEDTSGLTVVELMWHTLVDGTVNDDIDVVTNFVHEEILREWSSSMLLVWLRK